MNWKSVTEKKLSVVEKKKKEEVIVEDEEVENKWENEMVDFHDTFDLEYGEQVTQVKIELKEWIFDNHLPLMNRWNREGKDMDYTFYEFMIYNTEEGMEVKKRVENQNQQIVNEMEENEEWMEEWAYQNGKKEKKEE
jgi:hypothetical protein